jgi:hypothetical protein
MKNKILAPVPQKKNDNMNPIIAMIGLGVLALIGAITLII